MSIWDALSDVLADRPVPRPADSVTVAEFAALMNCSERRAAAILRKKVAEGNLRVVWYRTEQGRPGLCYVAA